MGLSALRKCQIVKEATKGTAIAATAVMLGKVDMEPSPTWHRPDEDRGTLIGPYRTVKVADEVKLTFSGDATFEQLIYWLLGGVLGDVTPSGAGSEKTWVFTPAKTAAGTFNSFTLEFGDDVQAWESEYVMPASIELSMAMNGAWTVKVTLFGRQMIATTFTSALTPPTVETILGQKAKIYIDEETGTMGNTEKTGTIISCTYTINTGLYAKRYGDGQIYFSAYGEKGASASLKAVVAFNSSVNSEFAKYYAGTQRLVRIKTTGTVITSNPKALILDICGTWASWSSLGERDGEDTISLSLNSENSPTYGKGFEIQVVNAVGTLP